MMDEGRVGRISSSSVYKLMGSGKGSTFSKLGLTYIKKKQWELLMGIEMDADRDARATNWGTYIENRVFELLPLNYKLETHKRYFHPKNKLLTGSPDVVGEDFVGDIKSPWNRSSFCETMDCFGNLEKFKEDREEYYWQLVSNAILTNKRFAESIVYMPYKRELKEIKKSTQDLDESTQARYAFISFLPDDELPYIPDDNKYYKNLNIFRFEVPQEDKDRLIERVTLATEILKGVK